MIIISFHGGLGNQMFQYALFKKFQLLGKEVKADLSFYDHHQAHNGFELERIFSILLPRASAEEIKKLKDNAFFLRKYRRFFKIFWKKTHIEPTTFNYDPAIFFLENAYLSGYWQSEKYFKDISGAIRQDFKFNIVDPKNKTILKKIRNSNSIGLHIRRGDYESHANTKKLLGGIGNLEYYQRAIKLITKKIKNPLFFVFSDDLVWARKNLKINKNIKFIGVNKGKDSYKDLFLMSNCKSNILTNSSFSWWAAWLNSNPKKLIICPKKWFNLNRLNSKDIIPSSWIRI